MIRGSNFRRLFCIIMSSSIRTSFNTLYLFSGYILTYTVFGMFAIGTAYRSVLSVLVEKYAKMPLTAFLYLEIELLKLILFIE